MLKYAICFSIFIFTTSSVKHSCRDENNNPVDWYVIYKLPRLEGHENNLVVEGKAYAYITSQENNGWILSERPITDKESIPGLTLAPIYKEKSNETLLYMLYNDQPPGTKDYFPDGGHAKGAVVADNTGGFWLVHSVPRYAASPNEFNEHTYPKTALKFGQSFLCLTLERFDLELAGNALWYNDLHVNAKSVPKHLEKMYPSLVKVVLGEHVETRPWHRSLDITSAGGTGFRVFAKSEKYHKELYSRLVAPELRVNLLLQTWPNGKTHQDSSCRGRFRVENIDTIEVAHIEFHTTKDHSKWTISKSEFKPWVCVGDINKDDSQEKRGGGTVCLKDTRLWEAYYDSVVEVDSCEREEEIQTQKFHVINKYSFNVRK